MTTIEDVLETYLADDLRALCATPVGYPLLSTTFSGIELLGALLSQDPFSPHAGDVYFREYWSQHLYPGSQSVDQATAIYKLARHGVAHQFFVKGEIAIMSGERWQHLTYDGTWLWLDTHALADDLLESYRRVVKPRLADVQQRALLDQRFAEVIAAGKADSVKLNLATRFPATPSRAASPGNAGPTGPI